MVIQACACKKKQSKAAAGQASFRNIEAEPNQAPHQFQRGKAVAEDSPVLDRYKTIQARADRRPMPRTAGPGMRRASGLVKQLVMQRKTEVDKDGNMTQTETKGVKGGTKAGSVRSGGLAAKVDQFKKEALTWIADYIQHHVTHNVGPHVSVVIANKRCMISVNSNVYQQVFRDAKNNHNARERLADQNAFDTARSSPVVHFLAQKYATPIAQNHAHQTAMRLANQHAGHESKEQNISYQQAHRKIYHEEYTPAYNNAYQVEYGYSIRSSYAYDQAYTPAKPLGTAVGAGTSAQNKYATDLQNAAWAAIQAKKAEFQKWKDVDLTGNHTDTKEATYVTLRWLNGVQSALFVKPSYRGGGAVHGEMSILKQETMSAAKPTGSDKARVLRVGGTKTPCHDCGGTMGVYKTDKHDPHPQSIPDYSFRKIGALGTARRVYTMGSKSGPGFLGWTNPEANQHQRSQGYGLGSKPVNAPVGFEKDQSQSSTSLENAIGK